MTLVQATSTGLQIMDNSLQRIPRMRGQETASVEKSDLLWRKICRYGLGSQKMEKEIDDTSCRGPLFVCSQIRSVSRKVCHFFR